MLIQIFILTCAVAEAASAVTERQGQDPVLDMAHPMGALSFTVPETSVPVTATGKSLNFDLAKSTNSLVLNIGRLVLCLLG